MTEPPSWLIGEALAGAVFKLREKKLKRSAINKKLLKIFLMQLLLVSGVTVGGVLAAALIAEEVLVNQALQGEAEFFWQRYSEDPSASLPNSLNLLGYLARDGDMESVPQWLHDKPMGKSRARHNGSNPIVHLSQNNNDTLFLVFNEQQVTRLSFFFGILPLTLVLLVMYGVAYGIYRQAKNAISPVQKLAGEMRNCDVNGAAPTLDLNDPVWNADEETYVLVDAINGFTQRVQQLVERERNFTRYASHELRTPLTVIKGSVANLERQNLGSNAGKHISRIRDTADDMGQLIEVLLELARETRYSADPEPIQINDLIELLVERHNDLHRPHGVAVVVKHLGLLQTHCPRKLVSILVNNLINNAQAYTPQGQIDVIITSTGFSVVDTGLGIAKDDVEKIFAPFFRANCQTEKGFGLGLAIVDKICNELGWKISVSSELGKGTTFTVTTKAEPV